MEPLAVDFLVKLVFGLALTLPGAAALGVVLVNLAKIPGWVTDGNAPVVQNVLSVVFALIIGGISLFAPQVDIPGLDVQFGQFAQVLVVLLPTFALLYKWLAPLLHNAIKGFPGIGYSYSLQK